MKVSLQVSFASEIGSMEYFNAWIQLHILHEFGFEYVNSVKLLNEYSLYDAIYYPTSSF